MPTFFIRNHEIGHYSGYQTTVHAEYFFEILEEDELPKLKEAYAFSQVNNIPFLIIGGGTNLLFSKSYFPGVIIKNSIVGWKYDSKKQLLYTHSNESLWDIASELENKYKQIIWHRFIGLPGSVGGAVFGNAGCFGLETESNFLRANVYDMYIGKEFNLSKEEMQFSYRHSYLKENPNLFLIGAYFDLSRKMEKYPSDVDNIFFREHKQPKGNCCGSFFKNPTREVSAGMLIEKVGLKGYHYGGAYWSDLHGNFLMSEGELCKPEDLLALVKLTQKKVKEESGYDLINEVRII